MARLRAVRLQKLLTQTELAQKSGVSQGTIARIETDERTHVQLRTVRGIASALRIDPSEIDEFRPSLGMPPADAS